MTDMTQIWAHRGASGDAPENTLPAMEEALEEGADGVELDVQLTRDDEVVVIHDETLERTTDGAGWVADHSLEELRRLDASGGREGFAGARIPLLREVLDLVAGAGRLVNIELKNNKLRYHGLEERVLQIVAEAGAKDQVILSSFNHYSLRRILGLRPSTELGALYSDPLFKPWKYVDKLGVGAIHPPMRWANRKVIDKSQERGLSVHVWTVNAEKDIRAMIDRGVDAIITDVPRRARNVRG